MPLDNDHDPTRDPDPDERPIVFIGFMATGKSTVGRLLATRLGRPFIDLDRAVEESAQMTVAEIFRAEGEPAFRRRETAALARALATPRAVIATGGGAACNEENLQAMLSAGHVVALKAPVAEVITRAGRGVNRPLLVAATDKMAAAARLLEARAPFYARAHTCIDTSGKSPRDVMSLVLSAVRKGNQS